MKVAVIGTGYVGLVAGVCFADAGSHVHCVDKDPQKINTLLKGEVPIYEPGLEDLLKLAIKNRRIQFSTDLAQAVRDNDVIFIAVGTPEKADGSADMGPTFAVVEQIAQSANGPKFVVLKSTVPIGTAAQVREHFQKHTKHPIDVISNPEFLKEGSAINDFLKPDRVVIGCKTEAAKQAMQELYGPFVKNGHPIYFMDNVSAEMTKYAANCFLSVKISFINELANLADKVGADIERVKEGFTSDSRINKAFFYPGLGYGGSCFPKDVKALIHTAEKHDMKLQIVNAADEVNDRQKTWAFQKVMKHFGGNIKGLRFAVWGLSFKPRTDDVREAPALYMIEDLVKEGAQVVAFDPVASENAQAYCKAKFEVADNMMTALKGADALILCTEWNEFRSPDLTAIKSSLKKPIVIDGRNVFTAAKMKEAGFEYYCVGRQILMR